MLWTRTLRARRSPVCCTRSRRKASATVTSAGSCFCGRHSTSNRLWAATPSAPIPTLQPPPALSRGGSVRPELAGLRPHRPTRRTRHNERRPAFAHTGCFHSSTRACRASCSSLPLSSARCLKPPTVGGVSRQRSSSASRQTPMPPRRPFVPAAGNSDTVAVPFQRPPSPPTSARLRAWRSSALSLHGRDCTQLPSKTPTAAWSSSSQTGTASCALSRPVVGAPTGWAVRVSAAQSAPTGVA
mmetsp:Transcript_18120/g.43566  ORF Transcript_18120/g.43566 Transcript_18120/m.43566 type:complete len:242 (-) Transcript_18120:305-1030(-)